MDIKLSLLLLSRYQNKNPLHFTTKGYYFSSPGGIRTPDLVVTL